MATTDGPAGKRQEKLILGCYVDDLFRSRRTPTTTSSHSTTRSPPPYSRLGTSRTRVRLATCSMLRSSAPKTASRCVRPRTSTG
eukprot:2064613-Prymnesium_polylepis.1